MAAAALVAEESNRLLYVALTRARDGLVIGGWEKPHGVRTLKDSNYALLSDVITLSDKAKTLADGTVLIMAEQAGDDDQEIKIKPNLPPKAA